MTATPAARNPVLTINRVGKHLSAEISGILMANREVAA